MPTNDSFSEPTTEELTVKQEQLITLLLAGVNVVTAAKNIGVAEKTAHRWLKLPRFLTAYKDAQKSLFDQALTGLMLKVDKAISTLDRNMSDEDTPASVQVRSAQIVLEQSIQIFKLSEIEAKLAQYEDLFKQLQVGKQ